MNYIFIKRIIPPASQNFYPGGVEKICYPLKEGQTAQNFIETTMSTEQIEEYAEFSSDGFLADDFYFLNSFDLDGSQVKFSLDTAKETFVRVVNCYATTQHVQVEVDKVALTQAHNSSEVIALWPSTLPNNPYVSPAQ